MAGSTVLPFHAALVALAGLGLQCVNAATPLEVYGRLPQLEDVALAPGGERVALIQTQGDSRFIAIESLTEHKMLKVIAAGDQKVRSIRWADDDHLMIVTSMTLLPEGLEGHPGEWSTLQVYDVARATTRSVPTLDQHRFGTQAQVMNNVVSGEVQIRVIDGHTVLFVPGMYANDTDLLPALFRVDLQTDQTTLMLKGSRETQDWLIDQSGRLAARLDYDSQHRQWQVGIRQAGKWVDAAISGQEAIDVPQLLGFSNDSNAILMRVIDHGDAILRPLDLQQGKLGDPLPLQGAPLYDRTADRMIGAAFDDDTRYRFLDPAYQAHWDAITRAYAGEQVHLISIADGFQKAVVSVEGTRDGYAYIIVDLASKRAFPVGDIYQGLTQVLAVKEIEYQAADGLKIPAYLTLPSGRDPKALPLVVLPHGGPAAHDDGSFDWWSQALASQGYAVLQPNFRGSTLGWDFKSAGFGQVGRKMETDLSDGVSYLAAQGTIDPKRVCIVGASYGGYAALAGVTLFHGVYRCAVSVAGMSDLRSMMRFDDEQGLGESSRGVRYWDRFLGVQGADDPQLAAISPIKYASTVDAPVLMIHGTDDTVVAFSQSREMFKALQALGKPSELVILKHEDHWLSRAQTRLQMLQATVEFLRKHNPPD